MNYRTVITLVTKHIIWKISINAYISGENVLKTLWLTWKSHFILQGVANLITGHQCEDCILIQNTYISVADYKQLQILCSFSHQETDSISHSLNLGWHCFLFWLWECNRSDIKRTPTLSFKRLAMLGTLSEPHDWDPANLLEDERPHGGEPRFSSGHPGQQLENCQTYEEIGPT